MPFGFTIMNDMDVFNLLLLSQLVSVQPFGLVMLFGLLPHLPLCNVEPPNTVQNPINTFKD